MGPRDTVVYNSLPLTDLEECKQPPARQSHFSSVQNWKIVALLSLATNISTLWISYFRPGLLSPYTSGSYECHLESERLWGQPIGWRKVVLENQQEFIDSDPWDSKFGGQGIASDSTSTSPWDALFYSTWVALENDPASKGYGFGTPLTGPGSAGNDQDPVPWKEGSQAFGIGFMHQLHCVVSLKMAINDYRHTGGSRSSHNGTSGHLDHCLEVLRQATMCHGDTSLIRPNVPGKTYTGYNGWGNEHLCRDWEYVFFREIPQSLIKPSLERAVATLKYSRSNAGVNYTDARLISALTDLVKKHGIHYLKGGEVEGWTHWDYYAS